MIASKYLQRKPHKSISETRRFIKKWGKYSWHKNNGLYLWSLNEKDQNDPFGWFLLSFKKNVAEIHYGLSPEMWGRGFATEAGTTIIDWLKNQTDVNEINTICAPENTASMNVLSKIGLEKTALLKNYFILPAKGKKKCDAFLYRWIRE